MCALPQTVLYSERIKGVEHALRFGNYCMWFSFPFSVFCFYLIFSVFYKYKRYILLLTLIHFLFFLSPPAALSTTGWRSAGAQLVVAYVRIIG